MADDFYAQHAVGEVAALDDVSATEWRTSLLLLPHPKIHAALDDVSATEWRQRENPQLYSMAQAALDDVSATEWRQVRQEAALAGASGCTR